MGFGTSGRNSGFALDSFFHGMGPLNNPELSAAHARLCTGGLNILRKLVKENEIECGWHDWGNCMCPAGAEGDRALRDLSGGYKSLGFPGPKELKLRKGPAVTGSTFYTAGLKVEATGLMNPAAMCRDWVRPPSNVILYENTPVHRRETGQPRG
ncbi:MAG: hypothetical protein CM1200mP39_25480 [Dehalococcoidia bacterium]|nr:MAG: hypothetical protein CM1200mP39_25480 [Dehalococcoidia bacterium]